MQARPVLIRFFPKYAIDKTQNFNDIVLEDRAPDGYQFSANIGVGYEYGHGGTSNTYIMLIVDEGKRVLFFERKLVNKFPQKHLAKYKSKNVIHVEK